MIIPQLTCGQALQLDAVWSPQLTFLPGWKSKKEGLNRKVRRTERESEKGWKRKSEKDWNRTGFPTKQLMVKPDTWDYFVKTPEHPVSSEYEIVSPDTVSIAPSFPETKNVILTLQYLPRHLPVALWASATWWCPVTSTVHRFGFSPARDESSLQCYWGCRWTPRCWCRTCRSNL